MNRANLGRIVLTGCVVAAVAFQAPVGWAQPLEVMDVERTQTMVQAEVERLVADIAARDPELAQEIERQAELCGRDMQDGQLDHEGFTKDIENFREVRDVMEQMMGGGAEGEHTAPTPEMMERMSQEMGQFMAERPELAEYARAEFSEFAREAMEMFGHEMPDQGHSPDFERMMMEGHSPEDMARMMETFREMGGPEHFREMEAHYREMEAHYREAAEREYGARLDELAQHFLDGASPPPEGGHVPVEMHTIAEHGHDEGHWDGPDPDNLADHTHPLGTGPHTN